MGVEVVRRRVKGFTDFPSLLHQDILSNATARNDYNAFFFQNLARLRFWMQRPDTSSGISDEAGENLATRGAGWALLRYSTDNFSNGDARAFLRRLAAGPDTGITNFNGATGVPLDTVVAGWLVSNYADDLTGFTITNPKTQYRSFNMRSVMTGINGNNGYPLQTTSIGGGATSLAGTNRTGSGTYYSLSVAANSAARNVKVLNQGGTSVVSFPGAHI